MHFDLERFDLYYFLIKLVQINELIKNVDYAVNVELWLMNHRLKFPHDLSNGSEKNSNQIYDQRDNNSFCTVRIMCHRLGT